MASARTLQLHPVFFMHETCSKLPELTTRNGLCHARLDCYHTRRKFRNFTLRACSGVDDDKRVRNEFSKTKNDTLGSDSENPVLRLRESISSLPPVIFMMRRCSGTNIAIGLSIATAILFVVVRVYAVRRSRYGRPGSVADLVRRGQLRSDRRGISSPLKYDDPFNNPLVKVSKGNSKVEMCGKVYRMAPVTLTEEQQATHQKRRSRAYQWKRPKVFLKEGDSIPLDVDPESIRWIPANHPFASTASEIDEDLAQNNVYQKRGVPFRIQAEHDALQRKLERLQNEPSLNKVSTDPVNAKDFERPLNSHQNSSEVEQVSSDSQVARSETPKFNPAADLVESDSSSEERQKP